MRKSLVPVAVLFALPAFADLPSFSSLRSGTRAAWNADVAAWSDYAFKRRVTRMSYDENGNVTLRREMLFQVTPSEHSFDELLLEIDGRQATPHEVEDHREKHRFSRHYMQAGELELDNPMGEDLALRPIIQEQKHVLVGEEEVSGVPCYRTKFEAAHKQPKRASPREQLRYAIQGSACIAKDGFHLVEFDMETVRQVKKMGIGMKHIEMHIEGHRVGDAWLPKRVVLESDVVVFGKHMRKSNTYEYSDFDHRPFGGE